jgi:GT2 family glycosyltransferase/glycosyltransferase involved in cell wall biosynthesis
MLRLVPLDEESPPAPPPPHPFPSIEILVPLRNEWQVVRPCLEAVVAFSDAPRLQVTLLDDASDAWTQTRLAAFAARSADVAIRIVRNETALGFVGNANRGLSESKADLVVLLNSDTLVTPGWLARLVRAALSDARVAAVMPMSNQASFHSLALPMGWNAFQYAAALGARGDAACFDAVTASGFCLLFRREALDDVGLYDPAYGLGYGEESDWCMRARARGWRVLGVPDAFVWHRGHATFKDYKDRTFRDGNYELFMQRWAAPYSAAIARYHEVDALAPLRDGFVRMTDSSPPPLLSAFLHRLRAGGSSYAVAEASHYLRDQGGLGRIVPLVRERGLVRRPASPHPLPRGFISRRRPRVTYVLEKFSLSGGVLSVVQLVNRLTLLGWDAKIATHHDHDQEHLGAYTLYHQPYVFPTSAEMIRHFPESDVVVATLWSTAPKVARIVRETLRSRAVPWYFVQDDETRFFAEGDAAGRQAVLDGYPLIPSRIVKSDWLGDVLRARGFDSVKVPLGLDLDTFYCERPGAPRPLRVIGMARPRTPRRGFAWLVAALREVARARPDVEIALFGCENLAEHGLDFPHVDLGVVPNDRLRRVYNDAAVFLDTSAFQGFGRPGLEAMACGCATVLGRHGGVAEYARDGENALLIDPAERDAAAAAVLALLDDDALRRRFADAGLATAQRFDCDAEALATSRHFAASLGIADDVSAGRVPLAAG